MTQRVIFGYGAMIPRILSKVNDIGTRFAPTEHNVFDGITTCNFREVPHPSFLPEKGKNATFPQGKAFRSPKMTRCAIE